MEQRPDYYDILGVSRNAAMEEIKKSYKKLVLIYHPDVNPQPDSHEHFKEISKAYQTLSNPELRKLYDEEINQFHDFSFIRIFKYSYKKFSEKTGDFLNKVRSRLDKLTGKDFKIQYQAASSVHMSPEIVNMSVDELGMRLLHSSNPFVRVHAATALGMKSDKTAYLYLEKKLLDESLEVRRAVVWAIGNLRLKRSIPILSDLYDLCDSVLRVDIIKAVGFISGYKGAVYQKLLEMGVKDENLLIRKCVLNYLMNQSETGNIEISQVIRKISKQYKIPVETMIHAESYLHAGRR
jgi:curved DNA-binding protein CbpA